MGREVGKITRINKKKATVQLHTGEQCSVCAAKSACIFAGPNSNYRFIEVPAVKGVEVGDMVYIDYKESPRIIASLVVFLLPVLFILAGYAAGTAFIKSGNGAIWSSVAGFILSIPVLSLLNKWIGHSHWFSPKITGRAPASKTHRLTPQLKN